MFNIVLATGAIGCVVYGLVDENNTLLMIGGGLALLWVLSLLSFFIKGGAVKCSLCMSPLWASRQCQKNSKVKPALGVSYRLGFASSIIAKGHFRCPYCGEPFNAKKLKGGKVAQPKKGERRIRMNR